MLPVPRPSAAIPTPVVEPEFADVDEELILEDLTPDEVRNWRVRAMKDY